MGDFIQVPGGKGGRHFYRGGGARGGGRWNRNRQGRGRGRGYGRGRFNPRNYSRERNYSVANDYIEILGKASATSINIAIEGCCHGELDMIYDRLQAHEKDTGQKVDLLICCGDFQSHRNPADFHSSSIPPKYRRLGTFPKYYSGEKKAPILTLFIGGNHEASQPLRELYYGGWAAENIYYIGAAGVVRYGGIRIGGISGIYKSHDFEMGHFEYPPFDRSTLRSVYHVRNVDAYRMQCLSKGKTRVDVVVSHDWPLGIEQHGNTEALLRKKPYFRAEVQRNDLGSPPNRKILDTVQPKWWFSAHLHVKFQAEIKHSITPSGGKSNSSQTQLVPSQVSTREVTLEKSSVQPKVSGEPRLKPDPSMANGNLVEIIEAEEDTKPYTMDSSLLKEKTTLFHGLESPNNCMGPDLTTLMTKFLALDKCLPRRQYLSILHIEPAKCKEDACLEYDPEWLAILRKTHFLMRPQRAKVELPKELESVSEEDIQWIERRLQQQAEGTMKIPTNFQVTVPPYSSEIFRKGCPPLPRMGNPQTDAILALLDLDHIITVPFDEALTQDSLVKILSGKNERLVSANNSEKLIDENDENEIVLDEDDENDENEIVLDDENEIVLNVDDENEIALDEDDENEIEIEELPAESKDGSTAMETMTNTENSCNDGIPNKKARVELG